MAQTPAPRNLRKIPAEGFLRTSSPPLPALSVSSSPTLPLLPVPLLGDALGGGGGLESEV